MWRCDEVVNKSHYNSGCKYILLKSGLTQLLISQSTVWENNTNHSTIAISGNMDKKIVFLATIMLLVTSKTKVYSARISHCFNPSSTFKHGRSCPKDYSGWKKASEKLSCEKYDSRCHDNQHVAYHCVINAWINATIEVCAPVVSIVGNCCAEFNVLGGIIQENYHASCGNSTTPCPFYYMSDKAYKYQSCYKYIALNERPAADNYKPLHHIERKNKSIFDNQSHREKKSVTDQQWSNGTSSQFTARNGSNSLTDVKLSLTLLIVLGICTLT
ncbi:uncharacterized protein LOC125653717 [Ostrea edulis]|uniref:uncharacterized protein LOC125653717 n=1 Tax=Ostrea edulis TaxID=37623 RepID=UPI0024AFD49F|nr:uncharacterized protein LOC125653717 [Ostrea edulis]